MSPFNPDKFRLDSTSPGGVNTSIDRKIEKLSKKCAELIQKNKHKDAKKILSEIKELKALRLPEDESNPSQENTLITTPVFQLPESEDKDLSEMEKTLATTPLILDQETTVISPQAPPHVVQKIPTELDRTVVTMPFKPDEAAQENKNQEFEDSADSKFKNRSTIIGIGACALTFFVMAAFSFFAFKDFPGKGNYFDWLRAESVYQKAEAERNEGNFDKAIINYGEANKIYPELAKAADARGLIQILKGQDKDALSSFEDAAYNSPKNSRFQRDYANALRLNNQEVKALEIVTKLDTKDSAVAQNKALLALIQLQLKQPEADDSIRQATSNAGNGDTNFERDYYAGIFYRTKGDLANSQECFKRANKAEPMNLLALVEYIKAKELQNEDVTQETSDLTKIAPKWSGAYSKAALAHLKAGKNADAVKFAYDGLKLNNADFNCLDVITKADEHAVPDKMEELYQKALSQTPNDPSGWSGLALWQSKQENKSMQALESQARSVKLDQKNAAAWYQLALYLEMYQNKKEALRAAAEAMSLEPENEKYTDLRMKLLSSN